MVLSPDDSLEGNPLQCVDDSNNALNLRSTYEETHVVERLTPENQAPPDLDWCYGDRVKGQSTRSSGFSFAVCAPAL